MPHDDHNEHFPIPENAAPDTNHTAGAYDYETRLQCCVICGGILQNNRDAHHMACHPPDPNAGHSHWPEGPVYRQGNMTAVGVNEDLPECERPPFDLHL